MFARAKLKTIYMIDLLIKLICYEFDMTEKMLMSKSKSNLVTEPLSMMSYILHADKDMKVAEIYKAYLKRGFKKKRATIYNQVKVGFKLTESSSYFYSIYKGIKDDLNKADENGVAPQHDTELHTILGRILHKISNVKSLRHLDNIESTIDGFLQVEFLNVGSFEEDKVKFKKNENGEETLQETN